MIVRARWITLFVALAYAGSLAQADDWRARTTTVESRTTSTSVTVATGATDTQRTIGTPGATAAGSTIPTESTTSSSGVTLQPIRQPENRPAESPVRQATQQTAPAQQSGSGLRRAEEEFALVSVPVPSLQVSVRGPLQLGLREQATFDILVTNSSRQIIDVAHVSTAFGPGLRVRAISKAGEFDGEMNTMCWKLAHLLPGDTRTVRMSVEAIEPGEQLQWVVAAPPAGAFVEYRHLTQVTVPTPVPVATYPTTATPAGPQSSSREAAQPGATGSLPQRTPWWQRYNGDVVR